MIVAADTRFIQSTAPHSLGLANAMTIPSPGFDTNPLMINQKRNWGAGQQLQYVNTQGTTTYPGDVPRFGGFGRLRRWWGQRPHGEASNYQHWGMGGLGCPQPDLSGLTMDGTGLFGTGLFSSDLTSWGMPELLLGALGVYMLYSTKRQTKVFHTELQGVAHKRRKSKAVRLREKAKRLESQGFGGFGGLI